MPEAQVLMLEDSRIQKAKKEWDDFLERARKVRQVPFFELLALFREGRSSPRSIGKRLGV